MDMEKLCILFQKGRRIRREEKKTKTPKAGKTPPAFFFVDTTLTPINFKCSNEFKLHKKIRHQMLRYGYHQLFLSHRYQPFL